MKNFKLYSCTAIIAVASMFTSCMEHSNKRSGATFGIISSMEELPYANFAKTSSGNITSSTDVFDSKATSGDCCFFLYEIDFDNQPAGHPANYVDATITEYTKIDHYYAQTSNDNDATYTPSTQEVSFSAVDPLDYVENKLFISCEYKKAKGQLNSYNLLYNLDSTYTEDTQKVYQILFTASRDKTEAADEAAGEVVAFDIARLVEQATSEATSGSTSTTLRLKLKYINKLTTEEGKGPVAEWGETKVITIGLPVKTDK